MKRYSYVLTDDFDPGVLFERMREAGIKMLTDNCPYKIKPPWRLDHNRVTDEYTFLQWDDKEPEEGPWGARIDGVPKTPSTGR